MARKARVLPSYLLHKPSNQARVRINGKDHYLGVYGTQVSHDMYDDLIADLVTDDTTASSRALTITEILCRFWRFAKVRYGRHGKGRYGYAINWRPIIRLMRENYGDLPAREFSPKKLRTLMANMVPSVLQSESEIREADFQVGGGRGTVRRARLRGVATGRWLSTR
jgi:hypothetical protein